MLPEQPISYPEFVADQLLTAANLNNFFNFLDVQERGTRINLIGIGIVCGLEVSVQENGTAITISKGCGITSQGYLVRWDEKTFQNYKPYDAAKERLYPPFYGGGQQRFPLDELKSDASEEGITKLSSAYLADKAVLLFVELLLNGAKNCDPESCDDKGSSITLTIRPLLVKQSDAANLMNQAAGGNGFSQAVLSLPEISLPRHHVPAGDVFDSGDVFAGFQEVLQPEFLQGLEEKLSLTYQRLAPLLQGQYATNPFDGLAKAFAFFHNGTINVQQMLYLQYYYDLFSDVTEAYKELRMVGTRLLSLCCPDENLFPRHLMLGVTGDAAGNRQNFRQYFIQSPAVACHRNLTEELRMLFERLVLLLQRFSVLGNEEISFNRVAMVNNNITNRPIRITPSKYGNVPLSQKAIPFYYNVAAGADKLYQHWDFQRSSNGTATRILSYHAGLYNTSKDEDVLQPLQYDLEPYNFLRIEGHVGRRYTEALATISQIRDANRLPFDVISLSADIRTLREQLAAIAAGTSKAALREGVEGEIAMQCHFQDLEALYDTLAQGLLCNLCKEMKYYYEIAVFTREGNGGAGNLVPAVPLLRKCDPAYRYKPNTMGALFEAFYAKLPQQYIEVDQFLSGTALGNAGGSILNAASDNSAALLGYALLYYIEKVSEILTTTLASFNIASFVHRYEALMLVAQRVKEFHQAASMGAAGQDNELALAVSEDIIDHLDTLLYACKDAQFTALYNDYKLRWIYLSMLQKFGYYVKLHPGIQHKAGVTMGGTFIIVYHERGRARTNLTNIFTRTTNVAGKQQVTEDPVLTRRSFKDAVAASKPAGAAATPTGSETRSSEPSEAQDAERLSAQKSALAKGTLADDAIRRIPAAKLKLSLSTKQMSIIDKLFFKDLITRHSLDELTAQLPDKIVIADFYLPYMCCSDCPPVYFLVNETKEEPEETPPAIAVDPGQFCQRDRNAYNIVISPAGGTVSGEGVTQGSNGNFVFVPATVSVSGDQAFKDVTLTYSLNGKQAQVTVQVYQQPSAAFTIRNVVTHVDPNARIFTATNNFQVQYQWDFGDGQQATGNPATHRYEQPGVYTVQLTATNGPCSDVSRQEVALAETPTGKSCGDLQGIIDLFNGLESVNPGLFKVFARSFESYKDIKGYFAKLQDVAGAPVSGQMDFFTESQVAELLEKWFRALNPLVQNSDFRQIAMALWRVLLQLAMYLMCIQDEDLGKTKIDLSKLFKLLEGFMGSWKEFVPNFNPETKAQLGLLLEDITAARDRVIANGEADKKKKYLDLLNRFIEMLQAYAG